MCKKPISDSKLLPLVPSPIAGMPFSILRDHVSFQSFTCSAQLSDVFGDSSLFVLLEEPVSLMTVFDVPVSDSEILPFSTIKKKVLKQTKGHSNK